MYYFSVIYERIILALAYLFHEKISGNRRESPVFIVSAGRSGSTLLRRFLLETGFFNIPPESGDLIPAIAKIYVGNMILGWGIQKKKILSYMHRSSDIKLWNMDLSNLEHSIDRIPRERRDLASLIRAVYMEYATQKNLIKTPYWGDKTPYLIHRLEWIRVIFPNAKIIHVIRDPRAVTISRKREFGESIEHAINRWKWAIHSAAKAKKRISLMEIKFEDMAYSPERTMKSILQFISSSLTYDKKYKNVVLGDDHLHHHRNVNQPVMRSKIYEWKTLISQQEKEYVEKQLSEQMIKYGYN